MYRLLRPIALAVYQRQQYTPAARVACHTVAAIDPTTKLSEKGILPEVDEDDGEDEGDTEIEYGDLRQESWYLSFHPVFVPMFAERGML